MPPLRTFYLPLTRVVTSSRHQLGIIWYYSSSYILYTNRFSLTGVVNIRLLVMFDVRSVVEEREGSCHSQVRAC